MIGCITPLSLTASFIHSFDLPSIHPHPVLLSIPIHFFYPYPSFPSIHPHPISFHTSHPFLLYILSYHPSITFLQSISSFPPIHPIFVLYPILSFYPSYSFFLPSHPFIKFLLQPSHPFLS